jgi:tetratricopeptide (TPR) repeat protein
VIDDERLQELLTKASSLYHSGEYKGAIDAWREALGVDPSNQKAQEGIRMATLLLGDWEPASSPGAGETADSAEPADGAPLVEPDLGPEETEARLDLGIARVKQFLAERKYSEAIEGARGLLPLSPENQEIQRLLEEAQHAFESSPFIEEHLTLARELMQQERYAEAEAECKKVFVLDSSHPGARTLLAQIREKIQGTLKRAADQLGGMTVKMTLPEYLAASKAKPGGTAPGPSKGPARPPSAEPGQPAPPAGEARAAAPPAAAPRLDGEIVLDGSEEPAIPLAHGPREHRPPIDAGAAASPEPAGETIGLADGEAAASQEDVAARSLLDAAFADAGIEPPGAGAEPPVPATEPPGTDAGPAGGGPATAAQGDKGGPFAAPTVVQAKTVVPAQVRLVPRTPPSEPAQPPAKASEPLPPAPSLETPPGDDAAWEAELTQLNIKTEQRDLLRGTPAKIGSAPPDPQADADLMSLLDQDFAGIPEPAKPAKTAPEKPSQKKAAPAKPGPVASAGAKGTVGTAPAASTPRPPRKEGARSGAAVSEAPAESETPAVSEAPAMAPRERHPPRRPAPPPPKPRSRVPGFLAFLGFLILAGGAAGWWFLYRPRTAAGAGSPAHPASPPSASSSNPAGAAADKVIPTPIGAGGRQVAQSQQGAAPGAPAAGGANNAPDAAAALGGAQPGTGAPAQTANAPAASGAAGAPAPGGANASAPARTAAPPAPPEPIKPVQQRALPPEEAHRRVASFTADGRRLMAEGKWHEARAKLNAALALDPANIGIKELADQTQAKIDEEQHLLDDFESAKKFFSDKDYENALRKFYRLPRDKGLGDIDRYIRNSWFNWAATSMKAGNATDALVKLKELLEVDPDDAEALKLQEVAEHYVSKAKDRVYYAFTDTLHLRTFDQK